MIGVEEVEVALRRAVNVRGKDYVYNPRVISIDSDGEERRACVYRDPNTHRPSCIVGFAVTYLLGEDTQFYESSSVDYQPWAAPGAFTPMALAVLDSVQSLQDKGVRWGYAVDHVLGKSVEVQESGVREQVSVDG